MRLARRLLSETEGAVRVHGPFPSRGDELDPKRLRRFALGPKRDLHGRAAEFDDAEGIRGCGAERARGVVGGDPGVEALPRAGENLGPFVAEAEGRGGERGAAGSEDGGGGGGVDGSEARGGHEEDGGGGEGGLGDVVAREGEEWGEGRARRGGIVVERGEAGFGAHDGFLGVDRGHPAGRDREAVDVDARALGAAVDDHHVRQTGTAAEEERRERAQEARDDDERRDERARRGPTRATRSRGGSGLGTLPVQRGQGPAAPAAPAELRLRHRSSETGTRGRARGGRPAPGTHHRARARRLSQCQARR